MLPRVSCSGILLGLVVLAAGLRITFFTGLLASDDTAYASNGVAILRGSFDLGSSLTAMRIGLDAAAAASFGAFGITELALGLPALVASLLTLIVVYVIALKLGGQTAATVTGLLFALSPSNVLNASVLLPEGPMGLFVALGILFFLLGERASNRGTAAGLSLAAGIAIGLGYLTKEPAALVLGAFVMIGAVRVARQDPQAWLWAVPIVGFGLVFALETIVYWQVSGELLHRFREIGRGAVEAALTSEKERQLRSLWLYPRSMFVVFNQVGLLFHLVTVGAVVAAFKRWSTPWLIVLWLVIPFVYLEFGTTSLIPYNLLPKQPRYLETLTAPATILVGLWAAQCLRAPGRLLSRMAYGALALYVLSAPLLTAISFIDRWAAVQPMRDVARFLEANALRPVHATSKLANGLWFWSEAFPQEEVSRVCVQCVAGPCTPPAPQRVGEVWAISKQRDGQSVPDAGVCPRWRAVREVRATAPPLHQYLAKVTVAATRWPPLSYAPSSIVQSLKALRETRVVTVNVPSEDP